MEPALELPLSFNDGRQVIMARCKASTGHEWKTINDMHAQVFYVAETKPVGFGDK